MFKQKKKSVPDEVRLRLDGAAGSVKDASARALDAATPRVEEGWKKVNALVDAGIKAVQPKLQEASVSLHEASDKVRPQVDGIKAKVTDDYAPRLTEKAGGVAASATAALAAATAPSAIEDLATKLTGDKKAVAKAQKALRAASKDIRKNTAAPKSSSNAWIWILLLLGIGGIVFYVIRKSRPVEDPWSTPLNNRPADARPVGSTPASQAVIDEDTEEIIEEDSSTSPTADPESGDTPKH